jgi:cytochrome c oxidase subunit 1
MWLTADGSTGVTSGRIRSSGRRSHRWLDSVSPAVGERRWLDRDKASGMDLLAGEHHICSASRRTISAVNTLTTIVKLRCEGMTWARLPLTVWGWFTAAMLSVIAFSVLLAALVLLVLRSASTKRLLRAKRTTWINGVMMPHRGDGSPLLWLHLFWFFGHPEVYIAVLPGMGLTSMVLANFARRRVFAYKLMIATTLLDCGCWASLSGDTICSWQG